MQRTIKGMLNAVVVIILVIWLLNVFGVLGSFQNIQI
ncbi:Thivi_2564 family membrane protein [Sunxiuqinia sp. sy24]